MHSDMQFKKWIANLSPLSSDLSIVEFQQWANNTGDNNAQRSEKSIYEKFINHIRTLLGQENLDILISQSPCELSLEGKNFDVLACEQIRIYSPSDGVFLGNMAAKYAYIYRVSGKTHFRSMYIKRLEIHACNDVIIENCWIEELILNSRAVNSFSVISGGILNITCPSPHSENPFAGSVLFTDKVHLPKKIDEYFIGPQPYRNMRAHMLKLENSPMVSLFHSLEQSIERQVDSSWFNKRLSWIYGALSDYGASSARPFWIWAALNLLTFAMVSVCDGAVVLDKGRGWLSSLDEKDIHGQLGRALVVTLQATFNPLNIFANRSPVIPSLEGVAAWLFVHSLISTLLLTLFFFAVRRRFKIG
jgi:hypothetical protein